MSDHAQHVADNVWDDGCLQCEEVWKIGFLIQALGQTIEEAAIREFGERRRSDGLIASPLGFSGDDWPYRELMTRRDRGRWRGVR